jgi:hypothetical protein
MPEPPDMTDSTPWNAYWELILHWQDEERAPLEEFAHDGDWEHPVSCTALTLASTSWLLLRRRVRTNDQAQALWKDVAGSFDCVAIWDLEDAQYDLKFYYLVAERLFEVLSDCKAEDAPLKLYLATEAFCGWMTPSLTKKQRVIAQKRLNATGVRWPEEYENLKLYATEQQYPNKKTREAVARDFKAEFSSRVDEQTLKRYLDLAFPEAAKSRSRRPL